MNFSPRIPQVYYIHFQNSSQNLHFSVTLCYCKLLDCDNNEIKMSANFLPFVNLIASLGSYSTGVLENLNVLSVSF